MEGSAAQPIILLANDCNRRRLQCYRGAWDISDILEERVLCNRSRKDIISSSALMNQRMSNYSGGLRCSGGTGRRGTSLDLLFLFFL
jgi:hypothetical protein